MCVCVITYIVLNLYYILYIIYLFTSDFPAMFDSPWVSPRFSSCSARVRTTARWTASSAFCSLRSWEFDAFAMAIVHGNPSSLTYSVCNE